MHAPTTAEQHGDQSRRREEPGEPSGRGSQARETLASRRSGITSSDWQSMTAWIQVAAEQGATVLGLRGKWRLGSLVEIDKEIAAVHLPPPGCCVLDGSQLEELDTSSTFALLAHLVRSGYRPASVTFRALQEHHERMLTLVHAHMESAPSHAVTMRAGVIERIGRVTLGIGRDLLTHVEFLGRVAMQVARLLVKPSLFRARATVAQFDASVLDAIPIISLVTMLIGVVFAYLLGTQAQQYGATAFVVDGVGLAICRELSPMLVAVIVAGRSGAAFTAQLGAMKSQEEVDAIQTLGMSPIQVLVLPRLVALTLGMPFLVFVGDLSGVLGGVLIAWSQLEVPPGVFFSRLHDVLPFSAVLIGLCKAPLFALVVALIACRMGLTVSSDARSVGEHTTSTVVQGIVWVIVIDAIVAVVLQMMDV